MNDETPPPVFPNYQPPQGMQVADRKQAGPLVKSINKLMPKKMKPRLTRGKRIQSDQTVHLKHAKKVTFW